MTSARPLLFVLLVVCVATSAFAAGDESESQASASSPQNQAANTALFSKPATGLPETSELFFLKDRPRLDLSPPKARSQSAILTDKACLTMRVYKVKRKEHFAAGESGFRGYTTCELASNYQIRSAVAHTLSVDETKDNTPQK
jgi:hypothetical protein